MKLVTLLTDFGTRDGYPGIMKGVIWNIAPDAHVSDLTHEVSPQDILDGALTLARAVDYFPAGTVFVGVVDPGVGTARRAMAARIGTHFFVCPDNGLLSVVLQQAQAAGEPVEMVHLDQPRFWLPTVSSSFHGRDIFAPVGAHLANGVPLSELGTPLHDPVRIEVPQPKEISGGWRGEVIHVDSFGNLATNLERQHIPPGNVVVKIAGEKLHGVVRSFGDGQPGDLVAMVDSAGKLAVAVVNGNAAHRLHVTTGEPVELLSEE